MKSTLTGTDKKNAGSFNPTKAALTKLWFELSELDSEAARLKCISSVIGERWTRDIIDIVDTKTLNLGSNTRYALICQILEEQEFAKCKVKKGLKHKVKTELAKYYAESSGRPTDPFIRRMDNVARWKRQEKIVMKLDPFVLKALLSSLNTEIRKSNGLPPLNAIELFSRPFCTASAVTDFCGWITGTPHQQATINEDKTLHLIMDTIVDNSVPHKAHFSYIRDSILEQNKQLTVINIHCKDQWVGLSAVVAKLLKELRQNRTEFSMPICHISLAKTPGQHEAIDSPKKAADQHEAVDLPAIINNLRAFYLGVAAEDSKPLDTAAEIETVINDIRWAMLKNSALIVIDGVRRTDYVLPAIENSIRDDDIAWLLNRLVEPLIHEDINEDEWLIFNQTKFIVTSDKSIKNMKGFKRLSNYEYSHNEKHTSTKNRMQPIEWPRPNTKELWSIYSTLLKPNHVDWVNHVYDAIPQMVELASENLTFMLSCCGALAFGSNGGGAEALSTLEHGLKSICDNNRITNLPDNLKEHIISWIWDNPANKRIWRFFWLFLVISPSGLRRGTFLDLYIKWNQLLPKGTLFPLEQNLSESAFYDELKQFKQVFKGIIAQRDRDYVMGYDEMPHPYEQAQPSSHFSAEQQDVESPRVLEVNLTEVRASFINLFVKHYGYRCCRIAHRFLAEESLRQQTISFRQASEENLASLRGYRRHLETLYHGYLSLSSGSEEDIFELMQDPFAVIQGDSQQAWQYLTIFGYMRVLERQDYRLARSFGADEIKWEILKLARSPARYRETDSAKATASPSIEFEFGLFEKNPAIINRLKVSMAQAVYISGIWEEEQEFNCIVETQEKEKKISLDENQFQALLNTKHHLFKRKLDIMMAAVHHGKSDDLFRQQHVLIISLCKARLKALLCNDNIESYIVSQKQMLEQVFFHWNFAQFSSLQKLAEDIKHPISQQSVLIRKLINNIDGEKDVRAGEAVDLLSRLAESIAYEAELSFLKHGKEANEQEKYIDKRLLVFAYLRFGEALRLHLVVTQPRVKFDAVSGHGARLMIRTALRLEELARAKRKGGGNDIGYFGRKARQVADVLCRHLFAYPRERASMLIIESSFARSLSSNENKIDSLKLALHFLANAEKIVESLDLNAHVRKRLRLERSQVLKGMSTAYSADNDAKRRDFYAKLAKFDASACEDLANSQGQELWWRLAESQSSSLDDIAFEDND